MVEVVDHLVELGHRQIVCLAEPERYAKSRVRVEGFLEAIEGHDLSPDTTPVVFAGYRETSGRQAAGDLLDGPSPPTAIVCCNDLLALGAMQAAQERGLVVGGDVSITGFDDIDLAAIASPPLTTVRTTPTTSGEIAADVLGRATAGDSSNSQTLLPLEVIIRGSTGPTRNTARENA